MVNPPRKQSRQCWTELKQEWALVCQAGAPVLPRTLASLKTMPRCRSQQSLAIYLSPGFVLRAQCGCRCPLGCPLLAGPCSAAAIAGQEEATCASHSSHCASQTSADAFFSRLVLMEHFPWRLLTLGRWLSCRHLDDQIGAQ